MLDDLENQFELYKTLIKTQQDVNGFIDYQNCDSLLFSGLAGSVPGVTCDLSAAKNSKGQWFRRPLIYPECFSCGGSNSTISKDMCIGLAWYIYANKRLDLCEEFISYALRHFLIIGKSVNLKYTLGTCVVTPGLLATFAEISYRLGGPNRWWLRYLPQVESATVTDFQAHLSVLHILLRQKLTGSISKTNQQILKTHAATQPNNPLFQIAVGNLNRAQVLLANSVWWPANQLPTTANRKEPWLVQRDYGSDWVGDLSVKPPKTHSGGDFLFCYALLTGLI